jgi:hypothetical protein
MECVGRQRTEIGTTRKILMGVKNVGIKKNKYGSSTFC